MEREGKVFPRYGLVYSSRVPFVLNRYKYTGYHSEDGLNRSHSLAHNVYVTSSI